ncbi:MAG TPA: phage protease [Azospirillum sp.]|nr:phage protease [Azospirillum sp.]
MTKVIHDVTDEQGTALATASAVVLPEGQVPEWVKLFGYGTVLGRDGRGPYTVRDQAHAQQIVATTLTYQAGADAPVDYDHQTQRSEKNGQPAPAAGWFKGFDVRPDGLYARTDWTAKAAQHLVDKEFRYISPTFTHTKDGTVIRIVGAGLTNLPNLEIPAIASQTITGDPMDPEELLKQIRAALGMAADASVEAIATHCQKLTAGAGTVAKLLGLPAATPPDQLATAAQAAVTALASTLKVTGDATIPALTTAAQQLNTQLTTANQVDLTKYVPMDVHLAVAGQLTELQKSTATNEVAAAVDQAIKDGKLMPAMKEWGLALANQNMTAFKDYVAKAPVLLSTASQTPHTPAPPAATATQRMDADVLSICNQLGTDATKVAEGLKKEGL